MATTKVAIVPGNGGGDIETSGWYASVRDELVGRGYLQNDEVELRNMPDPFVARECFWIPFMHDVLRCGAKTIIVGHSSGALAAMRYAEKYPVRGIVLVSAYVTDLGIENERRSEYFNRPWEWERIRENAGFIVQFGSIDDPFVPFEEQQIVADNLQADFMKFDDRGHFLASEFHDLVEVLQQRLAVAAQIWTR